MTDKKEKCARHRQVTERTSTKQNHLITYAAVIAAFLAVYCLLTFGMGHVFGVI